MESTARPRSRLPWQAVLLATVLATIAAVTAYALASDDTGAPAGGDRPSITLTPTDETPEAADRDAALRLPFTTSEGDESTLAEVVEGPSVVNFFASWCTPCVQEMPEFEAVAQQLAGRVTFFGIAVQDRPEDAERIVEDTGVTYGWGRDVKGDIVAAVGAIQMPTTVFVTADGTIAHVRSGALDASELRELIATHLGVQV